MGSFQLQSLDVNQPNTCILLWHEDLLQVKNNAEITVSFSGGCQHLRAYKEAKVQRTPQRQNENRRKRA